jgi:glycine oxidase
MNLLRVMPAKGSMTPHSHDVLVVGGGVIGLSVGWRAAQRGLDVLVIERDARGGPPSGASYVAAGMLAPVSEADPSERDVLELGLRSAALWPAFATELQDASGIDIGYRTCGTLLVAHDRDSAEALERERALREGMGLAAPRLLGSEARALEGALAPGVRLALDLADDHSVDPRAVVRALHGALGERVRFGAHVAELRSGEVVLNDGEIVRGERIVVAAGAWSGELAGVAVRPVKGQLLRLRDPAGPGLVERVLRFEGGYLVPRSDGRYVLGATSEERGFDVAVTAGGAYELLRDAALVVPGVLELEIEELIAGLRPATPDNAPLVGAHPEVGGALLATGHHRGGVLLAPVTAALVVDALARVAA